MRFTIKHVLATSAWAALGGLSNTAHAALSQYSFSAGMGQISAPIAGFTPQAGDVLQGTFSYLSEDTVLGSATKVTTSRYATRYVYEMPADARMDFTIGGHSFSSDKMSLVVSKSDWVEAGPDAIAVIGQNLTMDGVAVSEGLVGFEFYYPVRTFIDGLPPQTLQLNPPIPTGRDFAWSSLGYVTQNGGFSLSTSVAGGGGSLKFMLSAQALSAVPEPGTWALMLLGLGGVLTASARRPYKLGA